MQNLIGSSPAAIKLRKASAKMARLYSNPTLLNKSHAGVSYLGTSKPTTTI